MNSPTGSLKNKLRITAAIFAALVAGVFLFLAATLYKADTDILSAPRLMKLLSSYDIYTKVGALIGNTLKSHTASSGNHTASSEAQQKGMSSLLKDAASPEMVKLNVDNVMTGMLHYFKGESDFLPDIYLHPAKSSASQGLKPDSGNSTSADFGQIAGFSIDKINLSAILMYANRQDIQDTFYFIRSLHIAAANLPAILLIIGLICLLGTAALAKSKIELVRSAAIAASAAGISGIVSGCALFYTINIRLPYFAGASATSPIPVSIIVRYLRDLCMPTLLLMLSAGLLFPLSFFMPGILKPLGSMAINRKIKLPARKLKQLILMLMAVLVAAGMFESLVLADNLRESGFVSVYERLTHGNTQTKVIPAMNDNVYTLEVKLVDKSNGNPVSGALIELEGKPETGEKSINLNKIAGSEGSAKFSLEAGTFRIGFSPEMFPNRFILPSPFSVNLNSAGTTTVTVNLEEAPKISNTFDPAFFIR